MGKSRENKATEGFICKLALQPGAMFPFPFFPKQDPFRSDKKGRAGRVMGRMLSSIRHIFACDKNTGPDGLPNLPRARLNVHRRTTNVIMALAPSFSAFAVLPPNTESLQRSGNHPQAAKVPSLLSTFPKP